MNEKTLKTLEFPKIIQLLEKRAESSLGKEKARSIRPYISREEIEEKQEETNEAYKILIKRSSPPLYGIYDLSPEVKRLEIGGDLEASSLLKITDSLRVSRELKNYIKKDDGDRESTYPKIELLINKLESFKYIEDKINKAIISADEISDNASNKLLNIRREKNRKNEEIRKKLDMFISSEKYTRYLQDNIVTLREGRYVVPVKQESKNNVEGIIHDTSASGATVFVEPMAIVQLNNDLRELKISEKQEIKRILKSLSDLVRERLNSLKNNQFILQELDFIFAKGKLALDLDGVKPKLNDKRFINIKKARHPLIARKDVVPIDIYLGENFNTLVITGPNTGGKTVTLKTVGLLTLMSQSGLHIPADFNSEIGVFDNIFADIGDEQSIEQSLSTFSSHMTNIVDILNNMTDKSLVLFDELGAGTDPTEGAALAMAILDNLLEKNIRTLATTHYSQLKLYALTREGVQNASVEFDVESLSPTYKLLIGLPGKSNAFEISKRLGLQDYIIDSARKLLSQESIDFEGVLESLEKDRIKAEEDRLLMEKHRREIETLKESLKEEQVKLDSKRDELIKKAKLEARNLLKNAKLEADELVSEVRYISSEIIKDRDKKLEEKQRQLKTSLGEVESSLAEDLLNVKSNKPPENLKVGETVKVLAFDQVGEVISKPDEKGQVQVQVGIMKITANIDGLVRSKSIEENKIEKKTRHIIDRKSRNVKKELDLRGFSLDDALLTLDKYIDDAYIAGLREVQIIHGKGTGVLRSGVSSYLKSNRNIKGFRLGELQEGGDGVTVATFK